MGQGLVEARKYLPDLQVIGINSRIGSDNGVYCGSEPLGNREDGVSGSYSVEKAIRARELAVGQECR